MQQSCYNLQISLKNRWLEVGRWTFLLKNGSFSEDMWIFAGVFFCSAWNKKITKMQKNTPEPVNLPNLVFGRFSQNLTQKCTPKRSSPIKSTSFKIFVTDLPVTKFKNREKLQKNKKNKKAVKNKTTTWKFSDIAKLREDLQSPPPRFSGTKNLVHIRASNGWELLLDSVEVPLGHPEALGVEFRHPRATHGGCGNLYRRYLGSPNGAPCFDWNFKGLVLRGLGLRSLQKIEILFGFKVCNMYRISCNMSDIVYIYSIHCLLLYYIIMF